MGSLQLMNDELGENSHDFSKKLAAVQFTDADGVEVVATLNPCTYDDHCDGADTFSYTLPNSQP